MLDRRAMFAHGLAVMPSTSPSEVCHACHRDAASRHAEQGDIPCPACGDRLFYRLRRNAADPEAAIYAHCNRAGCIAILG
jgi:DNA-directed RNA polymerase subunit RPC12/RpoP